MKKGEDTPRAADTYKVDSRSAEFHMKKEGEGKLAWVVIKVTAPNRKPIERAFPCPPDVPFEAIVMAVLDEGTPQAATTPPTTHTPANAPK